MADDETQSPAPDNEAGDDRNPDEVESHPAEEGDRPDDAVEYDPPNVGEHMNPDDQDGE